MPWLMDRMEEQLERNMLGRTVLDGLLREVVANRVASFRALRDNQRAAEGAQPATMPDSPDIAPEPEAQPVPAEVSYGKRD